MEENEIGRACSSTLVVMRNAYRLSVGKLQRK
jgi:hypothetical protein